MRTAFDVLKRAIIKDFGKWYSFEWNVIQPEAKDKLQSNGRELAEKFWEENFLKELSDLWLGTGPGCAYINGKLSGGWYFEECYDDNLKRLKSFEMPYRYWVYSSFSFDDYFSLYGFMNKADAVRYLKKQKKREDDLFYSFMFRW